MLNTNSQASHQPLDLLERLGGLIEMGGGGEEDDALAIHVTGDG